MFEEEILNFKDTISHMNKNELTSLMLQLENEITQMVLSSDTIIKLSMVKALLDDLKQGE